MASHYDSNEKLPGIDTLPNLNLNVSVKKETMASTTYLPPPSHPIPCQTYSQSMMNPLYQSNISPPLTPAVSPSSMILGSDQFKRKYSVDIGPFGFGTSLPESIQDQDAFRRSSCSAMSMNGCTGESQTDHYDSVDSHGQQYTQFFGSNLQNTSFYTSSPLSDTTESDSSSSQSGKRGSRTTPPAAQHKHACKYPYCNWSFKRYEHLKRHMLVHTGRKPHVCSFPGCGKSFSRSDNFNAHYRTHTKKNKFNQVDVQTNQHIQPNQTTQPNPTNQQNQIFDNQYFARPSFDMNYQEIYRANYTPEENNVYHSQNQYLRNFNIPSYNSETNMLPEATNTFMNDRTYPIVYQPESQPGSQPKKASQKTHVCPMLQCQRSFKRLEHLKRHMRIHTLERPFACTFPGCQKTFSRSDNLSQHMKTHQKGEDRRRKHKRNGPLNWAS